MAIKSLNLRASKNNVQSLLRVTSDSLCLPVSDAKLYILAKANCSIREIPSLGCSV